jgi:hypothetical protein
MLAKKTVWQALGFTCVWGLVGTLSGSLNPSVAQDPAAVVPTLALTVSTDLATNTHRVDGVANGQTGGTFSLTSLSQYDDQGNLCSGYSYDRLPNHILELSQPVQELSIQVKSNGHDTTLVVRGEQSLDCGDDLSEVNQDAALQRQNWEKGVYEIWVGSSEPGSNYSYELEVAGTF